MCKQLTLALSEFVEKRMIGVAIPVDWNGPFLRSRSRGPCCGEYRGHGSKGRRRPKMAAPPAAIDANAGPN